MRKRRADAAQNENDSQRLRSLLDRASVIQNVFGHCKAESDHAGVNNSIDNSVKLILLPEKEDYKNQGLCRFFDDWSRDYCAHSRRNFLAARRDRRNYFHACVEKKGNEHR